MDKRFKGQIQLVAAVTFCLSVSNYSQAQQVYHTFEDPGIVTYFAVKGAKFDSSAANPSEDGVNGSPRCAKYLRTRHKYDYIKIFPKGKLTDVTQYASYDVEAQKLTMKVFTNAPAGTLIEIQLGKKTGVAYPDGTHSQYQARTTVSGKWEELSFAFSQTPVGSKTSAKEIDQITILFNPGTSTTDTFYFDDLQGPSVISQHSARLWRKK
jgi:hypothetical protein